MENDERRICSWTDAEVYHACSSPDPGLWALAWDEIDRRYRVLLVNWFIKGLAVSSADAEDLAQETLIRAATTK